MEGKKEGHTWRCPMKCGSPFSGGWMWKTFAPSPLLVHAFTPSRLMILCGNLFLVLFGLLQGSLPPPLKDLKLKKCSRSWKDVYMTHLRNAIANRALKARIPRLPVSFAPPPICEFILREDVVWYPCSQGGSYGRPSSWKVGAQILLCQRSDLWRGYTPRSFEGISYKGRYAERATMPGTSFLPSRWAQCWVVRNLGAKFLIIFVPVVVLAVRLD